jgi:hypothetical protein
MGELLAKPRKLEMLGVTRGKTAENTTMLITSRNKRKLVPHLGCNVVCLLAFATVKSSSASKE